MNRLRRTTGLIPGIGAALWILLMLGLGPGCTDRSRAVNAGLRDRIHVLERENEALTDRIQELEQHLAAPTSSVVPSAEAGHPAIPLVTTIAISGISGRRVEPDEDGRRPLDLHLLARDGRNRPVQLAGSVRLKVTLVPEDRPAEEIAVIDLSPEELREAWRGGPVGGPTWLVRVPMDGLDLPEGTTTLGVDVFYRDLRTGARLRCGDQVDIR